LPKIYFRGDINIQIQLSEKERMFLEDRKLQEEICIEKYKNYSQQAQDEQRHGQELFNYMNSHEMYNVK